MAKVVSCKSLGPQPTYDLEVDHPDHQFYLANGLLTSNSHAVSYAFDSYISAWLLKYYPAEWLCSYIEESVAKGPVKRSKAMVELKALGYKIKNVDINYASNQWTILSKRRFMPSFLTIKSVGKSAVAEIVHHRPFKNIRQMLWKDDGTWRFSKFNKRAWASLIKVNAFDSMNMIGEGKTFSSYRHMYHVIVENMDRIKHQKLGKSRFDALCKNTREIEDWTKLEKVGFLEDLLGDIDVNMLVDPQVIDLLENKKIHSISLMMDDENDMQHAILWFIIRDIEWKKTKNKKDYAEFKAMGHDGRTFKLRCWGAKPSKDDYVRYGIYLAEIERNEWGMSTRAWKVKEIAT